MEHDPDERPGWVRLPGYAQQDPHPARRAAGVRQVRRASNWTAAILVAGVAAATGYFAHHPSPMGSTAGTATHAPSAGQFPAAAHGTVGVPRPASGSAPVATSGGSGVAAGPAAGAAGTPGSAGGRSATVTWRDN